MSDHLLLVTLGPIQDFIAAARRTRDLWFGSHLLSELSRAAAKKLQDEGVTLIFPAPEDPDELEPCPGLLREKTGQPPLSIANKILAEVPDGADPAKLAQQARDAAQCRLVKLARRARGEANGLLADDIDPVWNEQLRTALEFCAAWAPVEPGCYDAVRLQVERAVAGRKNLREFAPWKEPCVRDRAPKSSLDGARDSVLRKGPERDPVTVQKFRVSAGEQLDAIGVLKRCGGDPTQFVPLRNVALAKWLEKAAETAATGLSGVEQACQQFSVLSRIDRRLRHGQLFGYDADVFFRERWQPLLRELEEDREQRRLLGERFDPVRKSVAAVLDTMSDPYPYVCCLAADGDHMGKALNKLKDPEAHRAFSQALAKFAPAARDIVESATHRGVLVYAGGDDVLAFLPVSTALACADKLRLDFAERMAAACRDLPAEVPRPTLSVGLGIGHTLTGMGDLLDLGRRAEKLAKKERNSLAVIVQKRGGAEDAWAAQWGTDPVQCLEAAVALLGDQLPAGKVSEVRERLRRSPKKDDPAAGADWADVLRRETWRIIDRAHGGDTNGQLQAGGRAEALHTRVGLAPLLESDATLEYKQVWSAVDAWVNLLRLAMLFKAAIPEGKGGDHE